MDVESLHLLLRMLCCLLNGMARSAPRPPMARHQHKSWVTTWSYTPVQAVRDDGYLIKIAGFALSVQNNTIPKAVVDDQQRSMKIFGCSLCGEESK